MDKDGTIKSGLEALFGDSAQEGAKEPVITHNVIEAATVEAATEEEEDELLNSVEDEGLREQLIKRREAMRYTQRTKSAKKTSADGYSRTSLIINEKKYAKIKEIAFRSTLTTKVVVEAAMDMLIEKYEEKHGVVVPDPKKYKGDVKDLFK